MKFWLDPVSIRFSQATAPDHDPGDEHVPPGINYIPAMGEYRINAYYKAVWSPTVKPDHDPGDESEEVAWPPHRFR